MNPALFRNKITFQRLTEGYNENGFPMEEWQNVKTAWSWMKTLSDKGSSQEFYEAATTHAKNTISFIVRYTNGLDTDMRIVYKGRQFEILSIINDNELNKTLTIVGREIT